MNSILISMCRSHLQNWNRVKLNTTTTKQLSQTSEAPGISVFYQDDNGDVFHTYSAYARGLDNFNGTYRLLDLTPKGRDEDELEFTMAWVRRKDQYED